MWLCAHVCIVCVLRVFICGCRVSVRVLYSVPVCVCVSYWGEITEEKKSDTCSQEASSVISEETKHTGIRVNRGL